LIGGKPYEFERFNNFNTRLMELMAAAKSGRQKVQHICIHIMKPLFF
jgi:hypothetical protein